MQKAEYVYPVLLTLLLEHRGKIKKNMQDGYRREHRGITENYKVKLKKK